MKHVIYTFLIAVALYGGIHIGRAMEKDLVLAEEQHELCKDDKLREAWIAKKDGIRRCFREYREYPHRSRGSHLD